VTQEFDSAALELINNAYGLSGVDAEQQTFLDDGNVQQLLPIDGIARRSRAPFPGGIFQVRFSNAHVGAGQLESFVDPYNPVNVHNGYPAVVDPRKAEIWVLSALARADIGGNVNFAMIGVDMKAVGQGCSDTAAGGPVTPSDVRQILGGWDDFSTFFDGLGTEYGMNAASGAIDMPLRRRWAPGEQILFRSNVSAAAEVFGVAVCFIGPVTLGQDLF